MERKKNGQNLIKEMISTRMLVLSYTLQLVVSNVCNKCQTASYSSS